MTSKRTADDYINTDFDESELSKLRVDIERLNKQKQSVQEKIDCLLDLYLDSTWPKEKLDENRRKLDVQLLTLKIDLTERSRKRELIQNSQINYDTVSEFLSVATRFEQLLDESDQQKLIGGLFPKATIDSENDLLILHALLPQNVTVDIKVIIESMQEATEREMLEQAELRYNLAQKHLNNHRGLSLEALGRVVGSQPITLKLDQERFGSFKYLAPNKFCPNLKLERIEKIKRELMKNPEISMRKMENSTGINRKMIAKLIKEEGLKP